MRQVALIAVLALAFAFAQENAATQLWMQTDAVVVDCPRQFETDDTTLQCASWTHGFELFRFHLNRLVEDGWEGLEPAGPWESDRENRVYSRPYYGPREVTRLVFAEAYFSEREALVLFAILE